MKNEFKRFGLEHFGLAIIILELIGAIGLLVGLLYPFLLLMASFGLTVLMFLGVLVRIKVKDRFWLAFPAGFYMILNAFIFWESMN